MKPLARLLFIASLYALNCGEVQAQTTVANQESIKVPITSNGSSTENALLSLPDDYSSTTTNYPLLVFLHGMGEAGTDLSRIYNSSGAGGPAYFIGKGTFPTSFVNPADNKTYKFIILSPQAPSYSTSAQQLNYVLQYMVKNYRVDLNRIYLTGLSAGGDGIVGYTSHSATTPLYKSPAIVPMSAAISTPTAVLGSAIAGDNVRVWGFGSVLQDIFGLNTQLLTNLINAVIPGLARFTDYKGGHCCWNTYYNPSYKETINGKSMNIYEWMLQYSNGTSTPQNPPPATNQLPVANAGSGQTITLPDNSVSLNGNGSRDPDGSISTYSWTKTAGPSAYTIASPSSVSTNVTGLAQGTYTFTLTVTDNGGATNSSTVQVVVNGATAANQAPTANAGPDQTIYLPQDSAILDGSGSKDVDGSIVKYEWNTVSGSSTPSAPHAKPGGRSFRLKADAQGYLVVDNANGTYKAGDTIYLSGYYKSVAISNMSGASDNYITFTNTPGQSLIIGDSLWSGGAYAQGLVFRNCHYIEVAGDAKSNFKVIGSNSTKTDANGYPVRTAYMDLAISELSDNFVVHDLYIRHGGAGLFAKTEISSTKSNTWYPNTFLNNFEFYNLDITNTYNEAMYIGHTAAYWNINTNAPYYPNPTDPTPDPSIYKRPIKLTNVKIHDNFIHDIGNDAIQTAAIDGMELYNNEVTNWAMKHGMSDNGGILIGGRVKGFNVHDNYVHDGWGELMQVYGEGGATATIQNNLLVRNQMEGVSMRGSDNLIVNFIGNTVAYAGENALRINGYFGQTGAQIVNRNLFIHPKSNGGTILANAYIYTENGGKATEGTAPDDNKKYASTSGLSIDEANYFLPALTSPANNYGYKKGSGGSGSYHTIVSPNSPVTVVRGLKEGTYIFKLTVTDDDGVINSDEVTVVVKPGTVNKAPKAIAGADQTITLPTNSVSLKGSGSDEDGSIKTYAWAKVAGPSQFTIGSAGSATTAISNLVAGVYQFELTVTDDKGATGKDTVQVTVNAAANALPVVKAGADQTITLPTNSVTLSGSATDADGTISTYAWTKISGPTQGTIGSPDKASTSITNLAAGVYKFELAATDDKGGVVKDTVQVTVNAEPNKLPVAKAGNDQTITLPTSSVTLTGSATDADGTISSYAWVKISGPTQGTIGSPDKATTSVTGLAAGVYKFELTATDNKGGKGKDTVQITVNVPANLLPDVDAGIDQTISLPTNNVTLTGSATDADGTISGYTWTKIAGPTQGTIGSPNSSSTSVTSLVAGVYKFELQAKDDKGGIGRDTIIVVVKDATIPNQAPTANAGSPISITLPVNGTTLHGSGTDTDGTVKTYSWTKTGGPAQFTIVSAGSATTDLDNLVEGTYTFRLTVTDDDGATASSTVDVTVIKAPNQAPSVWAGADQTITLPTNSVTLSASASDADGTIASYTWSYVSGPSQYTIVSGNSATTDVKNLVEGTYQFRVVVTDNDGAQASNVVNVEVVKTPNAEPNAYAGPDQTITMPTNSVSLNGAGSDVDGTISSYAWSYVSGPSQYTIVSGSSAATAINNLAVGTYVFRLTVKDNEGATSTSDVTITVNAKPNTAPTANAGSNQAIALPYNSVTLSGSGSDVDGTISSYSWTYVSGPSQYTIVNAGSASTAINNLTIGTYVFRLTVTDDDGAKGYDEVQITVAKAPNVAPTADGGGDHNLILPTNSVTLIGKGTDIDGTIVSYNWTYLSGPSQYTIESPNSATTEFKDLVAGAYALRLTVTDNNGATAYSDVTINVNLAPNKPPVADAGADKKLNPSGTINLDGTASYDPDGQIVSYYWTKVSGPSPFTMTGFTTPTPSLLSALPGVYVFKLTVTDDRGGVDEDEVTIEIIGGNHPPIANAGADTTLSFPANRMDLNAAGSTDDDGSIVSYNWRQIAGPGAAGLMSTTAIQTAAQNLLIGKYQFELTVTDNEGAVGKDTVSVEVSNGFGLHEAIKIYPNPTTDVLNYMIFVEQEQKIRISIIDVSGRTVKTSEVQSPAGGYSNSIDVRSLTQRGVYFFEILYSDGRKKTYKFLKM